MITANRLCLTHGRFRAELAPALGGRLTLLQHAGRDIVVPLPEDHHDPLFWGKGGGYPLVPYHNRIQGAQLQFSEAVFHLIPHYSALPHTLHGPAHCRPWRLVEGNTSQAVLALDYKADSDWPWAFEARQSFALTGDGFAIGFTLRNTAETPMPAGLGWHPYFPAGKVTHDGAIYWPFQSDYLPTGRRFRGRAPEQATQYVEAWTKASVAVGGLEIILSASKEFSHLVVHRAGTYVCLEPATHVANGFNLAAAGCAFTGTKTLDPGETVVGSVQLTVRERWS